MTVTGDFTVHPESHMQGVAGRAGEGNRTTRFYFD
jgi:hypothetical protein